VNEGKRSQPNSAKMTKEALFDHDFWVDLAAQSPELADNPKGADHLVLRYLGQYLPALLRSRTREDRERVWLAFWSYLVARASRKKPFGLSHHGADDLIARFQEALQRGAVRE
jgi:hypothetical protein